MNITNKTKEAIIACTWDSRYGSGDDIVIEPGETKTPQGVYIGEMGGGDCRISTEGDIVCHDEPDDEEGFHVSKGHQLELTSDDVSGVTVRHYSEGIEKIYWPCEYRVIREN